MKRYIYFQIAVLIFPIFNKVNLIESPFVNYIYLFNEEVRAYSF